jgi:UDP-N-acetylmuramyl pentapeptide phosphotransferase/UDP-N-acetylglucosamine-1-phosphate transferase
MYDIVLAFITSFLLTFFAIPSIISVARKKELVDEPGDRRAHSVSTPSLGGIAIFAGTIFSIILWTPFRYFGDLQYILCACIIIFLIGAKDDIDPIAANRKIFGQVFAACILIFFSKLRITSFYGIFGITELPILMSIAITLFIIILIINAFNLIDGINGLSGSIGILMAVTFGTWFYMVERIELASISFALAGSVIAFLYYNITPAKIFMGDTGSLLLGLVASILSISFIEHHQFIQDTPYVQFAVESPPAIAVGILILPLFDTLRVFVTRMLKGHSPFKPDRNHIHHLLLDLGYSHMQSTAILIVVNIGFIFIVLKFQSLGSTILLFSLLIMALVMVALVQIARSRKRSRQKLQKTT